MKTPILNVSVNFMEKTSQCEILRRRRKITWNKRIVCFFTNNIFLLTRFIITQATITQMPTAYLPQRYCSLLASCNGGRPLTICWINTWARCFESSTMHATCWLKAFFRLRNWHRMLLCSSSCILSRCILSI